MRISDVLDYLDLVLAQYGDLDVGIYTEFQDRPDFALNEVQLELLQVPLSRLSDKVHLIVGFCFGDDFYAAENKRVKELATGRHLKLVPK